MFGSERRFDLLLSPFFNASDTPIAELTTTTTKALRAALAPGN
jgi:hypothetical protein